LVFLKQDAAKWRQERECSTCHHGTMTTWALIEAKEHGFNVDQETLADMVKWTKDRLLARIDLPRDTRPGWSMVNTPAMYLSLLSALDPKQDAVSADELRRIAGHLVRHQEADGSWSWASAPPKNRPPPFFESDEVATLLASMALASQAVIDPKDKPTIDDSRAKASAWLAKATPTDTTQAAALRLLLKARAGTPSADLRQHVDQLVARQNQDGGWSQVKEAPSDGYATGQALYVLRLVGVKSDRVEMQRGIAFLVSAQKDDGSWPMKGRSHPGATPSTNLAPITHFGSAWATLALIRCAPE
jgi:squalene-hopene/tetraprenyl-beta-curcumene cyclase